MLYKEIHDSESGVGYATFSQDQRSFMRDIEGCPTNSFILNQLIANAIATKGDLYGIVIDFRNAFGSIDHKVIEIVMEWLRIPEYIQEIIKDIYTNSSFQVKLGKTKITIGLFRSSSKEASSKVMA